jgi:hypothetical protein
MRAVPVPPGEHTVELRYESAQLAIGVVISSIASLLLVLLELAALIVNRTQARGFRR